MDQLKTYIVPLLGLVVLGVWFLLAKPRLEVDPEPPPPADVQAGAQEGAANGKPEVVLLDPKVQGEMDATAAREVAEKHLDEVEQCYVEALGRKPDARGRLLLHVVVRGRGTVRSATVAGSQVKDEAVGRCISKRVAEWTYPESAAGGSTQITYPFQLQIAPAG
jgi:hypothetical protein